MKILKSLTTKGKLLAAGSVLIASFNLQAAEFQTVEGIGGNTFDLFAKTVQVTTPDGDSIQLWTFAPGIPDPGDANNRIAGVGQYPGPTLILQETDAMVTVTLHNEDIPYPVSLDFPGQDNVSCDDGGAGTCATGITTTDQPITYSFDPNKPGTFLYQSGVSPQVQVDMGLAGAIIVRPAMPVPGSDTTAIGLAYNDPSTAYDREYLFFLSEMDPKLHYLAQDGLLDQWDNGAYQSVLFFQNGRNAPDTMAPNAVGQLPHQPYGNLVKMYPGERILARVINIGRTQHPLHLHGNHFDQIARDGNSMMTDHDGNPLTANVAPVRDYTLNAIPGSTADLIFEWTGREMGWDIFNSASAHDCTDNAFNRPDLPAVAGYTDGYDDDTWEWCPDHGKAIPVVIPEDQDLTFGGFYGGSPYLGDPGSLPIGEGGLNPTGGMVFMWHSHSERELTNNDIFPGGMMTMLIVERRPQ